MPLAFRHDEGRAALDEGVRPGRVRLTVLRGQDHVHALDAQLRQAFGRDAVAAIEKQRALSGDEHAGVHGSVQDEQALGKAGGVHGKVLLVLVWLLCRGKDAARDGRGKR